MPLVSDDGLYVRARAARRLIADGALDPVDGLLAVVWPSDALADASEQSPWRRAYPESVRAYAIELRQQGVPLKQVARLLLGDERRARTIQRWAAAAQA